MHLTLHIQTCCVITAIMEIDKKIKKNFRELSYHNPTYITEGNRHFRELEAEKDGRGGGSGCLPVGSDVYLSGSDQL